MTPQEVSDEFGFSTSTMAKWRMNRKNLSFSKFGKYIRYKRSDVIELLNSNIIDVCTKVAIAEKKLQTTPNEWGDIE